jgi:hypothetical protein
MSASAIGHAVLAAVELDVSDFGFDSDDELDVDPSEDVDVDGFASPDDVDSVPESVFVDFDPDDAPLRLSVL